MFSKKTVTKIVFVRKEWGPVPLNTKRVLIVVDWLAGGRRCLLVLKHNEQDRHFSYSAAAAVSHWDCSSLVAAADFLSEALPRVKSCNVEQGRTGTNHKTQNWDVHKKKTFILVVRWGRQQHAFTTIKNKKILHWFDLCFYFSLDRLILLPRLRQSGNTAPPWTKPLNLLLLLSWAERRAPRTETQITKTLNTSVCAWVCVRPPRDQSQSQVLITVLIWSKNISLSKCI